MFDSEGFHETDNQWNSEQSLERSLGSDSYAAPHIYEPSATESDSSSEHFTSSDDSEDSRFVVIS